MPMGAPFAAAPTRKRRFPVKGAFAMHNARMIREDLYYVGASDRRLNLFENVYPIPMG